MEQQLSQLREQAACLRITAARDGRVIAPSMDRLIDSYVHEGDPLMTVASEADKEVVAVVNQDSIREVRRYLGRPVHFDYPRHVDHGSTGAD